MRRALGSAPAEGPGMLWDGSTGMPAAGHPHRPQAQHSRGAGAAPRGKACLSQNSVINGTGFNFRVLLDQLRQPSFNSLA